MRLQAVMRLIMPASAGASHLTCTICEPGTFCFEDSSTLCSEHSNSSVGSATVTDCVCVVGYHDVANECLPCPTDHFCVEGSEATTQCPANTVSPKYGSLLEQCLCVPGYTGNSSTGCMHCPAGMYKTVSGTQACAFCAQGTYSTSLAQNHV